MDSLGRSQGDSWNSRVPRFSFNHSFCPFERQRRRRGRECMVSMSDQQHGMTVRLGIQRAECWRAGQHSPRKWHQISGKGLPNGAIAQVSSVKNREPRGWAFSSGPGVRKALGYVPSIKEGNRKGKVTREGSSHFLGLCSRLHPIVSPSYMWPPAGSG